MKTLSNKSLRTSVILFVTLVVGVFVGLDGIVYAQASYIRISPDNPTMYVGQSLTFTAQGYNSSGTPCPIIYPQWEEHSSQCGTIHVNLQDPNICSFTATEAGNGWVACWQGTTFEGIHGSTDITIKQPGPLTQITITPQNPTIYVGQSLSFTAQGYDASGNPCLINNPQWSADERFGYISLDPNDVCQCNFTATQAGTGGIACMDISTGTYVDGSTHIYIKEGGQVSRIDVTPSEVELQVGGTQQFIATGYDANYILVPIEPNWSASGGAITSGSGCLYMATSVGDFTVTAYVQNSPVTGIVIGTARVHVGPDDDEDGIINATEDNAPNNGDGNGDGVPDSLQSNVTSLPSATEQGYITVETTCIENQDVWTYTELQVSGGISDPNYGYRYGLLSFKLPCSNAVVTVLFHDTVELTGPTYRQYGRTPPNFDNPGWYELPNVTFGAITIAGQSVAYAQFTLTDGEFGDDTPLDGWIVNQSGPAQAGGDFNIDSLVGFIDMEFPIDQ